MHTSQNQNDIEVYLPVRIPARLLAFGGGLLTGVSIGILVAPAGGREIRRGIVGTARRGRENTSRLVDQGRRGVARQKERANEIRTDVTSAKADAQAAMDRTREQVQPR
jgi:hypothetical protein